MRSTRGAGDACTPPSATQPGQPARAWVAVAVAARRPRLALPPCLPVGAAPPRAARAGAGLQHRRPAWHCVIQYCGTQQRLPLGPRLLPHLLHRLLCGVWLLLLLLLLRLLLLLLLLLLLGLLLQVIRNLAKPPCRRLLLLLLL